MTIMLITKASGVREEKINLIALIGAKRLVFTNFDFTVAGYFQSTK